MRVAYHSREWLLRPRHEIVNSDMVRDPKLIRWLEEGLTLVTEACLLISRVHRSKKAGDVERALRKLLSVMLFVDKAVTLDMFARIKCSTAFLCHGCFVRPSCLEVA